MIGCGDNMLFVSQILLTNTLLFFIILENKANYDKMNPRGAWLVRLRKYCLSAMPSWTIISSQKWLTIYLEWLVTYFNMLPLLITQLKRTAWGKHFEPRLHSLSNQLLNGSDQRSPGENNFNSEPLWGIPGLSWSWLYSVVFIKL